MMQAGRDVHKVFESITWIDELPELEQNPAGKIVLDCLKITPIRLHFERPEDEFKLMREQPFEIELNGEWISGVIDRLIICYEKKKPQKATIIDYKTNRNQSAQDLRDQYENQLDVYRKAVSQILNISDNKVSCYLLSTHLKEMIEI